MAFTFKKTNYILIGKENENIEEKKESVSIIPEGMWMKCVNCGDTIYTEDVENNNHICPKCGYNFRIDANHRLEMVLDEELLPVKEKFMVRELQSEYVIPDF